MPTQRFLLIASYPDSILRFRGELIDALILKGQEVHVASPNITLSSGTIRKLVSKKVHFHQIPLARTGTNPFRDLVLIFFLVRLIKKVRPHRVLSYTIKPVIFGTFAAWLMKVSYRFALITGLGYTFQDQKKKKTFLNKLVQFLYKISLNFANIVFFQNPDDEKLFFDLKLLPPRIRSLVVSGSGVDLAMYTPAPLPLGPRFLLIARLLGAKGIREYAEAARRIRIRHPDAVFFLVGWLDENPDAISPSELETWLQNGSIVFLGRLDDVRPAIADCNVYVLPSYREGTPRTVLEAMAMGRAVITTDAPGCRETVVEGENGYLVPVQSVDALEAAMQCFIDDPFLMIRMGGNSRIRAEEKYDVHKVNAVMLREMGIS